MISLGLDVSRDRMGWGVADFETGAALACGALSIAPTVERGNRADGYDPRRPALIAEAIFKLDIKLLTSGYGSAPILVTLEAPYVGRSGQATVEAALAVGSAWQACSARWTSASLGFLQPKEWKARVDVPPDPRNGRKSLTGAPLRDFVASMLETDGWRTTADRLRRLPTTGLKPWPMVTAWKEGFEPDGSQDAADAGLIAVAAQRVNADRFALP
jgi:hypothetical protein